MNKQQLDHLFDLTGRVAIITGGSRGIGRSIAEGYALAGAKVVIASRKADACQETVASIEAAGGEALAVPTHMGELDQLKRLADATLDHFGGIDILVNNAANALAMPFAEMTPEAWEKSISVNLRGPVFLTQYCLPGLAKSDHASVINVSSAGAFLFSQFTHMYAAAKAGLLSYVRSNAAELAPLKIRVNGIAPGTIDTDMVRNNPPEAQEAMAKAALMRRAAHPDELIGLALFLASDASSFVTGATFHIDGGLVPR
jgi:NAD(P)-dependent dehydrogenase (short-subunit alcohol dehydrogenase family)